ncbi:maestro heat-like repeat family member 5 isoform X2 [Phalacrocorax carbo]|uniref:maestro heat-like repeat family member 5 isoform X2 n=1 Tax=Phalacrocorax carbo TaxID=9209 RepID=UPI003119CBEE
MLWRPCRMPTKTSRGWPCFQNMLHYMKRKRASCTALQFSEKLLLLFDDCSQLRETSICLFKDLMEAVVWCDRRRMKTKVRRGLLPLFFHMSDQSPSVAKVSRKALAVVAKILEWEELRHVICPHQTQRITECLLEQDRSRAEGYCHQSLPYLKDAQAPLREAAVRFIGLAARPLRDQSKEKLAEMCSALQSLQEDSDLSIRSLAAQTVLSLSSPRVQPRA